jgi:arginase family enzyme
MLIVKVPGVNGLGKTFGAKEGAERLVEGFEDFEEIEVGENLEEQVEKIESGAREYFELMEKPLFIGGDHSISFPCGKAFVETFGKESRIIVFDAHPDCMPAMKEPTHEEWLRALIERKGLSGSQVMLIGARRIEPEEGKFMNLMGIQNLSVDEIRYDAGKALRKLRGFIFGGFDDSDFEKIRARGVPLPERKGFPLYVSFDVDCLDSSVIGATGYPEPDGLSVEEVERLLGILLEGDVRGGDVVELHADKEGFEEEAEVVREVIRRFLSEMK